MRTLRSAIAAAVPRRCPRHAGTVSKKLDDVLHAKNLRDQGPLQYELARVTTLASTHLPRNSFGGAGTAAWTLESCVI